MNIRSELPLARALGAIAAASAMALPPAVALGVVAPELKVGDLVFIRIANEPCGRRRRCQRRRTAHRRERVPVVANHDAVPIREALPERAVCGDAAQGRFSRESEASITPVSQSLPGEQPIET